MTENAVKNRNLARAAVTEGDFKTAKVYYEAVHHEAPNDLEAEWFYLFSAVTEELNAKTPSQYIRLAEIYKPTLQYVAAMEEGVVKQSLAQTMIKGFPPLKDAIIQAMLNRMIWDRSAFSDEEYRKVSLSGIIDKNVLANDILRLFGEEKPYCLWVADLWKELIAERFKWSAYRNFQDRGKELWFDELAKKIKKYDPSYQMPQFKQAGCVSFGDATKVTPGQ